ACGILVGRIPIDEVYDHLFARIAARERLARPSADRADLLRDGFWHRNFAPGPRGNFAGGILDRADFHFAVLVVHLRDPPHLALLHSGLSETGVVDDEPFVQGADGPPRRHVRDS